MYASLVILFEILIRSSEIKFKLENFLLLQRLQTFSLSKDLNHFAQSVIMMNSLYLYQESKMKFKPLKKMIQNKKVTLYKNILYH